MKRTKIGEESIEWQTKTSRTTEEVITLKTVQAPKRHVIMLFLETIKNGQSKKKEKTTLSLRAMIKTKPSMKQRNKQKKPRQKYMSIMSMEKLKKWKNTINRNLERCINEESRDFFPALF